MKKSCKDLEGLELSASSVSSIDPTPYWFLIKWSFFLVKGTKL